MVAVRPRQPAARPQGHGLKVLAEAIATLCALFAPDYPGGMHHLFLVECGNHSLSPFEPAYPVFVLGGVFIQEADGRKLSWSCCPKGKAGDRYAVPDQGQCRRTLRVCQRDSCTTTLPMARIRRHGICGFASMTDFRTQPTASSIPHHRGVHRRSSLQEELVERRAA